MKLDLLPAADRIHAIAELTRRLTMRMLTEANKLREQQQPIT